MADQSYVGAGSGLGLLGARRTPGAFPRKGAWALYDERVGIVAELHELTCEFHVVDEIGGTVLVLSGVPLDALTQANYEHIPEARRPDIVVAHRLGYKSVPHSASLLKRIVSKFVG